MSEVQKFHLAEPILYIYDGYVALAHKDVVTGNIKGGVLAKVINPGWEFQFPDISKVDEYEAVKRVVDEIISMDEEHR